MMSGIHGPHRIDDVLRLRASARPEAVYLIEAERRTTYAAVDRAADGISAWLQRRGVGVGDRVVFHADNSTDFLLAVFGVLRAGATVVPIHPRTSPATAAQVLAKAEPVLVLADRERMEAAGSPTFALEDLASLPDGRPNASPAGPACIIFTSGSTGIPHGVVCGHNEILFAIGAINEALGQRTDDRVLCCLPFSFDYGLYQSFLVLAAGASLVIASPQINPLTLPSLLQRHRVTGFPLVPSLATALIRSGLLGRVLVETLRYATNTGDILPPRHAEQLSDLLHTRILPMYGLTECKRVAVMPYDALTDKPGSVGLPLPGTRVTLGPAPGVDGLGPDVGELLVQGPHVMQGYWREPIATAERFRVSPETGAVTLHSGDLFRRDSDGFLYFLGRDETLIRGGGAVFAPAEIEQQLAGLDAVVEAAVVGACTDTEALVRACVVTDRPTNAVKRAVETVLAETLGAASVSFEIRFLRKLPRTLNGKIDRTALAGAMWPLP